jgi:hypothetical protein
LGRRSLSAGGLTTTTSATVAVDSDVGAVVAGVVARILGDAVATDAAGLSCRGVVGGAVRLARTLLLQVLEHALEHLADIATTLLATTAADRGGTATRGATSVTAARATCAGFAATEAELSE